MTLHRLQLFASIAKRLNISQVSRELRISQPSISQQLKLLQQQFGVALFQRNGRGLILTKWGEAFRDDVEAILAQVERLTRKYASPQADPKAMPLYLGGSYGPSVSLLPSLMTRFKKVHSSVELYLRTGTSAEIQDLVLSSEIELALITNPYPSPILSMDLCRRETVVAFAAANHPLAKRKRLEPHQLVSSPLIIRSGRGRQNTGEALLNRLRDRGLKPTVFMRCESADSVKAAVSTGAGIGILYRDVVKSGVTNGTFKVLNLKGMDLTAWSYIVYSKEKPLSQNAQNFLALLRAARKHDREGLPQSRSLLAYGS
jgi:DNA-binding transcriptional LysR family regulator